MTILVVIKQLVLLSALLVGTTDGANGSVGVDDNANNQVSLPVLSINNDYEATNDPKAVI